jgi:hypothetical protein
VGQAILPAAGFSAGPVKLRIRLESRLKSRLQRALAALSKEIVAARKDKVRRSVPTGMR